MSDEPGHKAMLYFLEVLMNSAGPLTISQLAGRFGSNNFSAEMRTAAGGNESGLKQFLQKYPSLFTIRGNMVSLCDGKDDDDDTASIASDSSSTAAAGASGSTRRSLPDVSVEMEAVQFFQAQLGRREERWVPVKSLAGHLSQTSNEIRSVVGPQLEFRNFLLRHMHIFEVQGEMVALREGLVPVVTPSSATKRITFDLPNNGNTVLSNQNLPTPKTPPAQRKNLSKSTTGGPLYRSHSFGDKNQLPLGGGRSKPEAPVTMTANEYKAVMYVKDTLEQRGPLGIDTLLALIGQAGDGIRATIGPSRIYLENFLRKSAAIFSLSSGSESEGGMTVDLVKNAKLSVIITGSRPVNEGRPAGPPPLVAADGSNKTHEGKGKIFHVAKLWGIIDLGEHEHVFFDRSIMRQPMDDLQKQFRVGEVLCFSAVPAHKASRARWRATHVWKEGEDQGSTLGDTLTNNNSGSLAEGIDAEINEFLPKLESQGSSSGPASSYGDAELSGAGVVPIWNFKSEEERQKRASVTYVPENYEMSAATLSDLKYVPEFGYGSKDAMVLGMAPGAIVNGAGGKAGEGKVTTAGESVGVREKKFVSVACQTVSTSDIIATQLYQDS